MTVITRQRSENFAIIPNAVAEDSRLSFEARGLHLYLLAKPNNWKVRIADIQKAGNIGRDKAYRLIKELREAGYITVDVRRDASQRVIEYNYIVYDCAVPDRLPLPEKPEAGAPVPENPEAELPLPEKPVTGKAGSGKAGRFNKNSYLKKLTSNNESPFAEFWNGLAAESRQEPFAVAEGLYLALPADIERENAIRHWPAYRRLQGLRKKEALLVPYLRARAWRDLVDAPELDRDGNFVITPDREEWEAWLENVRLTLGPVSYQNAKKIGRLARPERWPPIANGRQLTMSMGEPA